MQNKNWYHNLRLKLLVVLCAVMLLGQGLFIQPLPALARQAATTYPPIETAGTNQFAVVSRAANKLEMFTIGFDSAIWHRSYNGSWGAWSSLGRSPINNYPFTRVEAVALSAYRIDIFGIDGNGTVWHALFSDPYWYSWESLGSGAGLYNEGIQAVSWGPGRIDLFPVRAGHCQPWGCGYTDPLLHKWYDNGTWGPGQTSWEVLDAASDGYISVVSHSANRLDLIQKTGEWCCGNLQRKSFDGSSWIPSRKGWTNLSGGIGTAAPFALSWGPNRIDFFTRGSGDGAIWIDSSADGGTNWTGWNYLAGGGSVGYGGPTAESWAPDRLDIFENRAPDSTGGTVYHKSWDGSYWGPAGQTGEWENLGTVRFSHSPEVVAWDANRLDLFGRTSSYGTICHKWWDGYSWSGWESLGNPGSTYNNTCQ